MKKYIIYDYISVADDDGSGGTLVSLPSPCGSECSTNTLVSCMSSLPTDPQSPLSPTHHPNNPTSTSAGPANGQQGGGGTYTISQPSSLTTQTDFTNVTSLGADKTGQDGGCRTSSSPSSTCLGPVETPLVRTSDLSDASSITTITDSRHGSVGEEK